MAKILIAMGNIFDKYPNMNATRENRIIGICAGLAEKLSSNDKNFIIHGGRTDALSNTIIGSFNTNFQNTNVHTYVPKTEVDNSNTLNTYSRIGRVFEKGTYTEQRRIEMVKDADLVIVCDGFRGVREIYKIAKQMGKVVLPVQFGVEEDNHIDTESIYFRGILRDLKNKSLINEWENAHDLNLLPHDAGIAFGNLALACVEGKIPRRIFITLPLISEYAVETRDITSALQTVCNEWNFLPDIVVDTDGQKPLIDEIVNGMNECIGLISILDHNRPNIYFETGYVKGQNKPVILCCKDTYFSDVAFDTKAYEILVWSGIEELKDKLRNRFSAIWRS